MDQMLADTSATGPVPRILAAAQRHDIDVAAFAGHPDQVPALRALGITRIAVATDIALVALGAERVLDLT